MRHAPDPGGQAVATQAQPQWQGFSPDGGALAYATYQAGTSALYVVPSTGGTALFLVDGVSSPSNTRFTPDGKAIAFGNAAGEIRTVPVSGGNTTLVASQGGSCFALSSDGTRVVYAELGSTLSSVGIGGGAPVLLDSGVVLQCPPSLVPGGARVIYASTTGNRIKVAEVTGASPPVTLPTTSWPTVNHAGTHAVYARSADGAIELARLSDGAAAWSVPGGGWDAQFSPDDATIARCGGTLDAIAVASGVATPLLSQGYSAYYCYGSFWWTSNGTLLGAVEPPPPPDGYRGGLYVTHLP